MVATTLIDYAKIVNENPNVLWNQPDKSGRE